MAKYYVTGYETPEGVSSREDVKRYQEELGVTVDGIWGPKTQAAYEASLAAKNSAASTPTSIWNIPRGGSLAGVSGADYGLDAFTSYYNSILSQLSVPVISVNIPSRGEIEAQYASALRPSVDLAIEKRRKAGDTNMAELDADAAARGMGSSTYVSSMKEREYDDIESDIMALEANYAAVLSERIADALQYYAGLEMQAQAQNAQMAYNAQSSALSLASQWYLSWLSMQQQLASEAQTAAASAGGSSSKGTSSATAASRTAAEYAAFLNSGLTPDERKALFTSDEEDWASLRDSLQKGVGPVLYSVYKDLYTSSGGGGGTWRQSEY